jgi:hypothetical protein
MKPPIENNIQNDVAFYLHECKQPPLAINFRDALRKELDESYGKESVEIEIKKQKKTIDALCSIN